MQRKREAHRAKVRPVASASIDQPKKEPAKEKNQELEMADEELLRVISFFFYERIFFFSKNINLNL